MTRRPRRRQSELTVYDTLRLDMALKEYLMNVAPLSERTQRWYEQKLEHFCAWAQARHPERPASVKDLDAHVFREYLAHITRNGTGLRPVNIPRDEATPALSSRTLHGYYQTLKTFSRWLYDEQLIRELPFERIKAPKVEQDVIETFTQEQLQRMLVAAKQTDWPLRNAALLLTLLDTGIRAGELCALDFQHLSLARDNALLQVRGKGRKERTVPLYHEARLALYRYLTRERDALLNERPDPHVVFVGYGAKPMTPHSLYAVVDKLGELAHVEGVRCSPHTFRHTFALSYLRAGGNIYHLSRLLGHTDVKVTEVYLRDYRLEDARAEGISVVGSLLIPMSRGKRSDAPGAPR